MKIAIIGCSYSAYQQEDVYENHWSFQMSQRFPQHEYFSYALGGRGIEFFQWCLLDAAARDIDAVFLSSTYFHRTQFLVDFDDYNNNEFVSEPITENFNLMEFHGAHLWSSSDGPNSLKPTPPILDKQAYWPQLKKDFTTAAEYQMVSEHRANYMAKWYKNAHKLYNFKHFVLLKFHKEGEDKYLGTNSVWHAMEEYFGIRSAGNDQLYPLGIVLGEKDDHWSKKGNTWVLDNFILKKPETKFLNSLD